MLCPATFSVPRGPALVGTHAGALRQWPAVITRIVLYQTRDGRCVHEGYFWNAGRGIVYSVHNP